MAVELWNISTALREAWRAAFSREVRDEMVRRRDLLMEQAIAGANADIATSTTSAERTLTLDDVHCAVAQMRQIMDSVARPPEAHNLLTVAAHRLDLFLRELAEEPDEAVVFNVHPRHDYLRGAETTTIVVQFVGDHRYRRDIDLDIERRFLPSTEHLIRIYQHLRRRRGHVAAPPPLPPRKIPDQKATAKSIEFLREYLTPEQRAEFDRDSRFHVIGNGTRSTYCIKYADGPFNVECGALMFCFGPEGICWPGDIMLAQKMALENDEINTLKIANVSPNRPGVGFGMSMAVRF